MIKKVFLDDLPRYNDGKNKGCINWKECAETQMTVKFIYEDIEDKIQIINLEKDYLYIKYLDKELFKIGIDSFKLCGLGKLLNKITSEFKIEIGTKYKNNKRDITIIDKKYIKDKNGRDWKYYQYRCNKCGFCDNRSWITEGNLLNGTGCQVCGYNSKIVVENTNSIVAKNETMWMIPYFQGGYDEAKLYTPQSNKKIYLVCPDCGKIKDKVISICNLYKNHSIGCSCGDGVSYPEKLMLNILEQLNLNFETEKIFDWCQYEYKNKIKQGRYDFYFELDDKKYIIETDGGWHNEDNKMNGQTKEDSKEIDRFKNKLAKEHDIKVIRINCIKSDFNYIKDKIIHSELSSLFDLNIINWLKCEEFAVSNLVKTACELKRDNPNYTIIQISKIMAINTNTIGKYLKRGNELGWCVYSSKEELIKNCYNLGKSAGIQVEIYKNGNKLNYPPFENASELSRQSEELFNIKLGHNGISRICRGERKQYKGFVFKYVNKEIVTQN